MTPLTPTLNMPFLDVLGNEERERLMALANKIQLRPGESVPITRASDACLYLVESGAFIERMYYGARTVPIVRIADAGELFNTNRLFLEASYYRSELRGIHIEHNSLYAWQVTDFYNCLKASPSGMMKLCSLYDAQVRWSNLNLYEAVAHSAYYRLVNLLVGLANKFGYLNSNGSTVLLPLKLTVKDLSECINVSRETGSNLVNKLRRKGIIGPGKYIKVELAKLREYASTLE